MSKSNTLVSWCLIRACRWLRLYYHWYSKCVATLNRTGICFLLREVWPTVPARIKLNQSTQLHILYCMNEWMNSTIFHMWRYHTACHDTRYAYHRSGYLSISSISFCLANKSKHPIRVYQNRYKRWAWYFVYANRSWNLFFFFIVYCIKIRISKRMKRHLSWLHDTGHAVALKFFFFFFFDYMEIGVSVFRWVNFIRFVCIVNIRCVIQRSHLFFFIRDTQKKVQMKFEQLLKTK